MSKIKYYAPSVDYAAKILNFLSRSDSKQSTLTEISVNLAINKSACLRVLKTLELNNLVYYNPETKKYSLGFYISVLGQRVEENLDYFKVINEYLDEAAEKTKLTGTLLQRVSSDQIMFISQRQPSVNPKLTVSIGGRYTLSEIVFGKWILANMSTEERDYHLRNGLKKITDNNVVDVDRYIEQLNDIKKMNTKLLISRGEYIKDIVTISGALYDWKGKVIAVISLVGVSEWVADEELPEITNIFSDILSRCNDELIKMRVESVEFEFEEKDESSF